MKTSSECTKFTPTSTFAKKGVQIDGIWLAWHQLFNVNTTNAPEQLPSPITAGYSQDPFLIDAHSPLAWSIALHCHYQESSTTLAVRPSSLRHRGVV